MAGAILFHGDDHDSIVSAMRKKATSILAVSNEEALICHGDYQEVVPTTKSYLYSMEIIQSVVQESALPPFRGKNRIIALLAVDRMLPVHANALLKTLEDAPSNFRLLLTTTRYNDIIKTILSRVQKEHVDSAPQLENHLSTIKEMIQFLSNDKYDAFFKEVDFLDKLIAEDNSLSEMKFRNFLESFMKVYLEGFRGSHLFVAEGKIVDKEIQRALTAFYGNIRPRHIIENLFLETLRQSYST